MVADILHLSRSICLYRASDLKQLFLSSCINVSTCSKLFCLITDKARSLENCTTDYIFRRLSVRLTSTLDNSPQASQEKELIATRDLSLCSPCPCRTLRAVIPGQKESAVGVGAHIRVRDAGMWKCDGARGRDSLRGVCACTWRSSTRWSSHPGLSYPPSLLLPLSLSPAP